MTGNKTTRRHLTALLTGIALLAATLSPLANADERGAQRPSSNAPPEIMQFGRLVGNWSIRDESLQPDGSWQTGRGAQWNWYFILDGSAIQDDWIAPAPGVEVEGNKRVFGTNIRIYNSKEARWEMAWAANMGAKIDTFTARAKGDDVLMNGNFNGVDTRITFFDISADSFSWKMEQRATGDQPWNEVYRIFGTRQDSGP